ncbi:MAG: hypothetical protein K2H76_06150 [Muribaculaceae bacterium]|nr:hypothetical protein [Muribaculaceae bacterium]
MTIREALKAKIQYPLKDNVFTPILIERCLDGEAEYTVEVYESYSFKGALADSYYASTDAINFSESDISVSKPDPNIALRKANALYRTIGEEEKNLDQPTVCVGPPPGTYVSH